MVPGSRSAPIGTRSSSSSEASAAASGGGRSRQRDRAGSIGGTGGRHAEAVRVGRRRCAARSQRRRPRRMPRRDGRGRRPWRSCTPACRPSPGRSAASIEPSWAQRSWPRPADRPVRKPARKASPTPVGSTRRVSRRHRDLDRLLTAGSTTAPSLPLVITRVVTRSAISSALQPVLVSQSWASYSLVNRYSAPSMSGRIVSPSGERQLLARGRRRTGCRGRGTPAVCAQHRVRVVGADHDEVQAAHPVGDRPSSISRASSSRPGRRSPIWAMSSSVVQTNRAVCLRPTHAHRRAVDAVPLQPRAVVGEVVADRPESIGCGPARHAEGDVGGDAAPPDLRGRRRGTTPRSGPASPARGSRRTDRERHQVVGGDGRGQCDLHDRNLPDGPGAPAYAEGHPTRWSGALGMPGGGSVEASRRRRRSRRRWGCRS